MKRPTQSIEDRFLAAQVAIENAIANPEIAGMLAEYGYDANRINEGKLLYDSAQELYQKQKAEYGEQFAATDSLQSTWDEAYKDYIKFVKIARVAFQNELEAFLKLQLQGERKKTMSGWLMQANTFYINVLADAKYLEKMANYGITKEKLETGKQLVAKTEAAYAAQKKETGEAQQATKDRDKGMDKMEEWLSDFIAIARIALEEKPQLLEIMGIVKPS